MDPRERLEDNIEAHRSLLDAHQRDMWTALPGIVDSFDPATMTVHVQPALTALYTGPDQNKKWVNLPILPDVPVVMPRGGGYAATFPIARGDECLVVFSSRCIDNWWAQGGVQTQRELRMHDLSDGFAVLGPWSQKTKIANVSTTTAQIRTADGAIFAEVDAPNKSVRLVSGSDSVVVDGANDKITLNAANVVCSGNLTAAGEITRGEGTGDQVALGTHLHGGINRGVANTNPPVAGT